MTPTPPPSVNEWSDGVVCFAGVDWWYHPRGHSECQIMRRLAGRTTVLWVNSIGMRTPRPGVTRRPWRRCWRKLRSTMRGLRRDASGMWVYSPLFIPRYTPGAVRLNGLLLRAQVRVLCRVLGIRRPSAWVTVPTAAHAALDAGFARTVFNRCDDFASFPQADRALIRSLERELLAGCDRTAFVSPALYAREKPHTRGPLLLGHGLDFAHFARDRGDPSFEATPNPLAGVRGPVIGFYGGIEDYTVDLDLLLAVAREFPDATLAVAGPRSVGTERLEREPNVRVLGPIPYADLPAVASRFDVGLMPWRRNAWIRACNPIKLKEYLALGFPIVSTPFPALGPYLGLVETGDSREGFFAAVRRALDDRDPARRAARRAAVRGESWDDIADRVAGLLNLPPAPRAVGLPGGAIEAKAGAAISAGASAE